METHGRWLPRTWIYCSSYFKGFSTEGIPYLFVIPIIVKGFYWAGTPSGQLWRVEKASRICLISQHHHKHWQGLFSAIVRLLCRTGQVLQSERRAHCSHFLFWPREEDPEQGSHYMVSHSFHLQHVILQFMASWNRNHTSRLRKGIVVVQDWEHRAKPRTEM